MHKIKCQEPLHTNVHSRFLSIVLSGYYHKIKMFISQCTFIYFLVQRNCFSLPVLYVLYYPLILFILSTVTMHAF